MKPVSKKILFILCMFCNLAVSGQSEKGVLHIKYDPDWQVINHNNADFFNRMLKQPYSLSALWSTGQSNFLDQLNYSFEDYTRRRTETKEAAMRLLKKYPDLNAAGCAPCRIGENVMMSRLDSFIEQLRSENKPDAGAFFRAIDSDEGAGLEAGPKCGWQFVACVVICAATIEVFPAYLACCAICLCQYCKNPPKWCDVR
jgi:hypothetical protein